jgi:hypothetical protein
MQVQPPHMQMQPPHMQMQPPQMQMQMQPPQMQMQGGAAFGLAGPPSGASTSAAFLSPQGARAIGRPLRGASSLSAGVVGPSGAGAPARYVPVEDGFVTTAGNRERGAKYGNATGSHPLTTALVTAGVSAGGVPQAPAPMNPML